MALDPTRLTSNMYDETKSKLHSWFDGFKSGLLTAEQAAFDEAIDKLAHAIAEGDAPITITEFDDNAEVVGTIETPNVAAGGDTKPATFTLEID